MLVVDEVRPSKDEFHASSMYNILKPMIVAPPDTLPLNDKYQKLRYVINVMRVFITTNDWMAMYIPPEDRRMFIMHSVLPQRWHELRNDPEYFQRLFAYFEHGGAGHVSDWLKKRDLSKFNPKAQVARTAGWEAVSNTWSEPETASPMSNGAPTRIKPRWNIFIASNCAPCSNLPILPDSMVFRRPLYDSFPSFPALRAVSFL